MYITHLSLTNFRNFTRLDIDLPTGSILLVGANAQGKTSLLEAIYYLATFVSFYTINDRHLINFLSARQPLAVGRIVADYCRAGASHRLEVRIIQDASNTNGQPRTRKEVLLDGMKRKVSETLGQFNAALFLPQMLRLVEGAPEERRHYLNLVLAQVVPHYAAALADYNRSLSQRNALLKLLNERGGDVNQLDYWDALLTASGSRLIYNRIRSIQELERLAASAHYELTQGREVLRLAYEPAYDPLPQPDRQYALPLDAPLDRSGISLEKIQQGFHQALVQLRPEEIARGMTTIGPHRDDLRFLCNGIDLCVYGSRGQGRTVVLALKLAEVVWMKAKTGEWPVLLLDEVLAELDAERRSDLLTRLSLCDQTLLTTTDLDLYTSDFVHTTSLWYVREGRLHQPGAGEVP